MGWAEISETNATKGNTVICAKFKIIQNRIQDQNIKWNKYN